MANLVFISIHEPIGDHANCNHNKAVAKVAVSENRWWRLDYIRAKKVV